MSGQLSPTGIVARSCVGLHRWERVVLTVKGCSPEVGRIMIVGPDGFNFQAGPGRQFVEYDDVREIRPEVPA